MRLSYDCLVPNELCFPKGVLGLSAVTSGDFASVIHFVKVISYEWPGNKNKGDAETRAC